MTKQIKGRGIALHRDAVKALGVKSGVQAGYGSTYVYSLGISCGWSEVCPTHWCGYGGTAK
jgi:hypothetical protein